MGLYATLLTFVSQIISRPMGSTKPVSVNHPGAGSMSRVCDYSGKRPQRGKKIVRRGKAKKGGGIGLNVTGISKRNW